jgi:hypothetical protein
MGLAGLSAQGCLPWTSFLGYYISAVSRDITKSLHGRMGAASCCAIRCEPSQNFTTLLYGEHLADRGQEGNAHSYTNEKRRKYRKT